MQLVKIDNHVPDELFKFSNHLENLIRDNKLKNLKKMKDAKVK
jgi:hypothetical protein